MKNDRRTMMLHIEPSQEAGIYDMYLYDDITAEGKFDWSTWTRLESETSAKYIRDQLAQIPKTATINLYINSNGGEVKEGVGIYNQLKRHGAKVNGIVDGNCYSVAFLILQACDHRVMNLGTSALVHDMWTWIAGNAKELRAAADDLDKLMESNRQVFLDACGDKMTEEKLIELMEAETFLTPDECLEYGFIDEVNKKASSDPSDPEGIQQQKIRQLTEKVNDLQSENNELRQQIRKDPEPVDPEKIEEAFHKYF